MSDDERFTWPERGAPPVGDGGPGPVPQMQDPLLQLDKSAGYPEGQPSMFLHGRWLHDIQIIPFRGYTTTNAGITTAYAPAAIHQTQPNRAACIIWIGPSDWYSDENVSSFWQIWGDNRHLCSGGLGNAVYYPYVYVPPDVVINYYAQIVNGLGVPIYHRHSVLIVDFDANSDKYEYGRGSLQANPAHAALVWP